MSGKDRQIARYILNAQIASDGGKHIYEIDYLSYHASDEAYDGKDKYILRAIKLIRSQKRSKWRYSVTDGGYISPFLVYFETRSDIRKLQISFHSFDYGLVPYQRKKESRKGMRIRWDRDSSRDSAVEAAEYFGVI